MSVPAWYQFAIDDLGLTEGKGTADNPRVVEMYRNTGYVATHDIVPWCGAAMATWMKDAGIKYDRSQAAAAIYWSTWGKALKEPIIGAVGVRHRVGGNHVFLFAGWADEAHTKFKQLGGNQGGVPGSDGAVTMEVTSVDGVIAWRWPAEAALPLPEQKFRKSGVIQGASVTGGTGALILADQAPKIADALQHADSASSTGTILGMLAGAVIIAAAVWVIYQRMHSANKEGAFAAE